jgi:hypothetical protein
VDYPLIDRELRRRERSRRTYMLRFAVGAVAFVYLFLITLSEVFTDIRPESIGRALTFIGNAFQFSIALVLPLLLTADLVAREKQERTLGLLLLADPTGFGVYGAKFLSAFLPTALLILAALPVLAIAAPFGGIEVSSLAVSTLLYLAAAFAVTAIGMLASIHANHTANAFFAAFAAVLIGSAAIYAFDQYRNKPFPNPFDPGPNPLFIAWLQVASSAPDPRWPRAVGLALVTGLIAVVWGIVALPRAVMDKPARPRGLRPLVGRLPRRRKARYWPYTPAEKILARRMGGWSSAIRPFPVKVAASLLLMLFAPITCFGVVLLITLIAYDVVTSVKAGRHNGAIGDVRLVADHSQTLAKWVFRSQCVRCIFYFPAMSAAAAIHLNAFLPMLPGEVWATLGTILPVPVQTLGAALLIALTVIIIPALTIALVVALACRQALEPPSSVLLNVFMVLVLTLIQGGSAILSCVWFGVLCMLVFNYLNKVGPYANSSAWTTLAVAMLLLTFTFLAVGLRYCIRLAYDDLALKHELDYEPAP